MKNAILGLSLCALAGCGTVEPAAKPASTYETFTIQPGNPNLRGGFNAELFQSYAFDGKMKNVILQGQRPQSDPPSGRSYGQSLIAFFTEYNPDDSRKPCDPAEVTSRTVALEANKFPYDTVRLRSVRLDFQTQAKITPAPLDGFCYALHTPSGWRWTLTPRPELVLDQQGGPLGPDALSHIVLPIGDQVTDQIIFTGIGLGGSIVKVTYEAAPE